MTPISLMWLWSDFRNLGQNPNIISKDNLYCSNHLGKCKGLGSCEPGKTNMYISYYKAQYHASVINKGEIKNEILILRWCIFLDL